MINKIDQEVAQAYSRAVNQWVDVNSNNARRRAQRYGRNVLVVEDPQLVDTLAVTLTGKDKLLVLKSTGPQEIRPSDISYRTILGNSNQFCTWSVSRLGLNRRELDCIVLGSNNPIATETLPNADRIIQETLMPALVLREGGSLIALFSPTSQGFVDQALKYAGYSSKMAVDLPQGYSAVRAIK